MLCIVIQVVNVCLKLLVTHSPPSFSFKAGEIERERNRWVHRSLPKEDDDMT